MVPVFSRLLFPPPSWTAAADRQPKILGSSSRHAPCVADIVARVAQLLVSVMVLFFFGFLFFFFSVLPFSAPGSKTRGRGNVPLALVDWWEEAARALLENVGERSETNGREGELGADIAAGLGRVRGRWCGAAAACTTASVAAATASALGGGRVGEASGGHHGRGGSVADGRGDGDVVDRWRGGDGALSSGDAGVVGGDDASGLRGDEADNSGDEKSLELHGGNECCLLTRLSLVEKEVESCWK